MRRYFGTDGIRGDAASLLTDEFVERLGRAAVSVLGRDGARMAILRDTRESGPRIERALARGWAGRRQREVGRRAADTCGAGADRETWL